jgi:hypothetical protein
MSSNEKLYYPIESIRNTFSKVSMSSFYKVAFPISGGLKSWLIQTGLYSYNLSDGLDPIESIELLCSGAILPGVSFKMSETVGNRQGVLEKYPVFKQYPELSLTFYVDANHKVIKFFEEWSNYIIPLYNPSGKITANQNGLDSAQASKENSYFKIKYPNEYTQTIYITKFERDLNTPKQVFDGVKYYNSPTVSYKFIKAYPNNIVASPVSYEGTTVLSYTVTFVYTRYFINTTDQVFSNTISIPDLITQSIGQQFTSNNVNNNVGPLNVRGIDQVIGTIPGFDLNVG